MNQSWKPIVKIGDFGTAVKVLSKEDRSLREPCGTSGYTGILIEMMINQYIN